MAPEVDIAALQRLRSVVDQLRDNLRKTERDLSEKNSNIDDVSVFLMLLTILIALYFKEFFVKSSFILQSIIS